MAFSVYDYSEFTKLLGALKRNYPGRQKPISYDLLAKLLGYNSPRVFSMVLNGRRSPSHKLVQKICTALDLNENEQSYVELLRTRELLAQGKEDQDTVPRSLIRHVESIETIERRRAKLTAIDLDKFAFISEWYYSVIKQLVVNRGAGASFDWICRKLGDTIDGALVQKALDRMVELKILFLEGRHYYIYEGAESFDVGDSIPSLSIKRHHAQAMQCAVNALYRHPMEKREYQSLVVGVKPEEMAEVKKFIRSFVESFRRKFGAEPTERICRLNLQFFEHTSAHEE